MTHGFDKDYWDEHWQQGGGAAGKEVPANPYLAREIGALTPGTALDAGCGEGAEAIWLAAAGWQVTAADIAASALERAARRAEEHGVADRVRWVEADLSTWEPAAAYDLVTTHYAHPAIPQVAFYDRLAGWVAPGGTLLVVGHLHTGAGEPGHAHQHGQQHVPGHEDLPPAEASVTAAAVAGRLDAATWEVVTAEECERTLPGRPVPLQDVVVRATRRS